MICIAQIFVKPDGSFTLRTKMPPKQVALALLSVTGSAVAAIEEPLVEGAAPVLKLVGEGDGPDAG
jgi:hypothetical protein